MSHLHNQLLFLLFLKQDTYIFQGERKKKIDKFIYSIIIGGALGNFFDRLYFFAVPDFIDFHFNKFHWFTFNMADIFITVGIIMLLRKELFSKNEKN